MIWALLAIIGVPLWLIAILLFLLFRQRSSVRDAPGAVACKVRAVEGQEKYLGDGYPRYQQRVVWVHDVLVVHGGNPFLTRVTVLGTVGVAAQPQPAGEPVKHLTDATTVRLRTDSGAVIELVTARGDVPALLGPLGPATTPVTTA
jgi:hypothetical protein